MKFKTLPIFLAFLLMGVVDAMGSLSEDVKTMFHRSSVIDILLPFFVFIAFAILSVPGSVMVSRLDKKKVLLLGALIRK